MFWPVPFSLTAETQRLAGIFGAQISKRVKPWFGPVVFSVTAETGRLARNLWRQTLNS